MRNRIMATAATLLLVAAQDSAAQIQKYAVQWKGLDANAVGFISLDLARVANPGSSSQSSDEFVTDFEFTVTGAFAGNGTFGLSDYDSPPTGGISLYTGEDALDFTRELVGQPTGDFIWGSLEDDGDGQFRISRNLGSLAPTIEQPFTIITGTGSDLLGLSSFRPALCGDAPVGSLDCRAAEGAKIILKDTSAADVLKWSWTGDGFEQADLGDPLTDTYYSLCIYDETAAVPALAAELGINRGEGWTDNSPRGLEYAGTGESFGVMRAKVKLGATGATSVKLQAGTEVLRLPAPVGAEFFDQDGNVTVQLVSSEGACWTSSFAAADTSRNLPGVFKARRK